MPAVLITYATGEGQTAKAARVIDDVLADVGFDVTTRHVNDTGGLDLAEFDGVLVGASVNNQRHQPEAIAFIEDHVEAFEAMPSGFFQLSLAQMVPFDFGGDVEQEWVDTMIERTGWHPDLVGSFAGAVKYTQYNRLERLLFTLIARVTTGDTDTSRDYEYTDWAAVEGFATEFAELVEAESLGVRVRRGVGRAVRGLVAAMIVAGLVRAVRRYARARPAAEVEEEQIDEDEMQAVPIAE